MIPKGLFTNIALIAVSIGIIFTYIKPTFTTISADQDVLLTYRQELEKVKQVNETLNSLVAKQAEVASSSERSLYRYLPAEVDSIVVQRDILAIVRSVGIEPLSLGGGDGETVTSGPDSAEGETRARSHLLPTVFSLELETSYNTLKELLTALTQNYYPLVVDELTITGVTAIAGAEGPSLPPETVAVSLMLSTYALTLEDPASTALVE